jgi:hypothetical protein
MTYEEYKRYKAIVTTDPRLRENQRRPDIGTPEHFVDANGRKRIRHRATITP